MSRLSEQRNPGPSPQTLGHGPKPAEETPRAEATPQSGRSVPPTPPPRSDAGGGLPSHLPPPAEAFLLADFAIAQVVLENIRSARAYAQALNATFPESQQIQLDTNRLRGHLQVLMGKLSAAERACMALGLPF